MSDSWLYADLVTVILFMSSNGSGSMEFSIRGQDLDAFFPIQVSFFSRSVYSDVDIESVFRIDDNSPVRYGFEKLLSTDSYQIV